MLSIPLEFQKTKRDALVDSGAYINVISERDIDKITKRMEGIHNRESSTPFKKQYENHQSAKDNPMQSYLKYRRYYDRKSTATPLKVKDYCYVLNPKADNQSKKFAFKDCIWTGLYIVVKALSNNNYVVRRTGTRYTQTLQRIRLRLYAPNQRVPDVTVKVEDQLPDPDVKTTHDDWYAQAWETEFGEVLFGQPTERENEEASITEVLTNN